MPSQKYPTTASPNKPGNPAYQREIHPLRNLNLPLRSLPRYIHRDHILQLGGHHQRISIVHMRPRLPNILAPHTENNLFPPTVPTCRIAEVHIELILEHMPLRNDGGYRPGIVLLFTAW
jgi:hypothetical protein